MRALLQRVSEATVSVVGGDGTATVTGTIGTGLLALVGVTHTDTSREARRLAERIATLRIFADDAGRMNRSVVDVGGGVLVVSQFTLYADTSRGRRPSYVAAAPPEQAALLVDEVVAALEEAVATVATGRFGARMQIRLIADGPVTISLEV